MPNCSICGTPIDKLPNWLDEVEINYRCALCAEATTHHPIEHDEEEEKDEKEAKTTQETEDDEDDDDEDEEESDD